MNRFVFVVYSEAPDIKLRVRTVSSISYATKEECRKAMESRYAHSLKGWRSEPETFKEFKIISETPDYKIVSFMYKSIQAKLVHSTVAYSVEKVG